MPLARVLYGPSRRALAASAAIVTTSYVFLRPLALDSAPPPTNRFSKLSIYPDPPHDLVLLDEPSRLEQDIGHVRRVGTRIYTEGRGKVQGVVDQWIGVEQAVERKVKEIVPKDEPTTPGILYVGVATLTGSVLGRNRFLLRFLLPPTFLLASLNYFLPKTSSNLYAYILSLESAYAPALASQQKALQKQISDTWAATKRTYSQSADFVEGSVRRGVQEVEGATGLKVTEAWGRAKSEGLKVVDAAKAEVGKAEKSVEDIAGRVREKAKEQLEGKDEPKRLV